MPGRKDQLGQLRSAASPGPVADVAYVTIREIDTPARDCLPMRNRQGLPAPKIGKVGDGAAPKVVLRISPQHREVLDRLADERGITRSMLMREQLIEWIEAQEVASRAS